MKDSHNKIKVLDGDLKKVRADGANSNAQITGLQSKLEVSQGQLREIEGS